MLSPQAPSTGRFRRSVPAIFFTCGIVMVLGVIVANFVHDAIECGQASRTRTALPARASESRSVSSSSSVWS
jgi:hypothetical protein